MSSFTRRPKELTLCSTPSSAFSQFCGHRQALTLSTPISSSEQLMSHEPRKEEDTTRMQSMMANLFVFPFSCVSVYSMHLYVHACLCVRGYMYMWKPRLISGIISYPLRQGLSIKPRLHVLAAFSLPSQTGITRITKFLSLLAI